MNAQNIPQKGAGNLHLQGTRLQFPKCLKVVQNTTVKADPFSRFVLIFVPSHFQCVFGDASLAHNF